MYKCSNIPFRISKAEAAKALIKEKICGNNMQKSATTHSGGNSKGDRACNVARDEVQIQRDCSDSIPNAGGVTNAALDAIISPSTLHNFLEKYQRIGKQTKDGIKNNKDIYNGILRSQNRSYINFKSS